MKKSVSKKLASKRNKVSGVWKSYRKKRDKVQKDKSLDFFDKANEIKALLTSTKKSVAGIWRDYQYELAATLEKSDVPNFSLSKVATTSESIQKYYRGSKDFNPSDLDSLVPDLLDRDNVKGVLVVLEVYDEENDQIKFSSDYISKTQLRRLEEKGKSIYDHVAEKTRYSKSSETFELRRIHLRIIYQR